MSDPIEEWYQAYHAYHKASDAYNARLTLVRKERERGNWMMDCGDEYQALNAAQKNAMQATEILYQTLKSDKHQDH